MSPPSRPDWPTPPSRRPRCRLAIWFFSDRYVLNTSDPLHATVAAIVAHIISEGPATAPPAPSLAITPTHASGASTSAIVGPFTVTSGTGSATVTATGADMFSDAAGTAPIANWGNGDHARPDLAEVDRTDAAVLQATAKATVPKQNVYLYDGNTPGLGDAQRLILALDSELTTTVTANAEFKAVGSLVVQKTIAGPAAGSQGQVTIHTVCGGTALTPDFVVASGYAARVPVPGPTPASRPARCAPSPRPPTAPNAPPM